MSIIEFSFLLIGIAAITLAICTVILFITLLRVLLLAKTTLRSANMAFKQIPIYAGKFARRGLATTAATKSIAYLSNRLTHRKGVDYAK